MAKKWTTEDKRSKAGLMLMELESPYQPESGLFLAVVAGLSKLSADELMGLITIVKTRKDVQAE